jgi:hypothetical protein
MLLLGLLRKLPWLIEDYALLKKLHPTRPYSADLFIVNLLGHVHPYEYC